MGPKEGRFMFAVLAAAAEYELQLRAERQSEGMTAAKRREAAGGAQRATPTRWLGRANAWSSR
ncbi:recombinase family protein [Nonomuraea sp. NPDC050451]|uniref:recombinase family protein n=1 Tax=Nonomuraea sp. NPDC050451 TaxID=3364364 RepID=UPI0037A6FF54